MPRKDIQERRRYDRERYASTQELQRAYSRSYRAAHRNDPEWLAFQNSRVAKWKKALPPEVRRTKNKRYNLKRQYGISLEEFERLKQSQGNKCAICGWQPPFGGQKELSVDHCHETKKVRGLLCPACNGFLGRIKDDWRKVMNYLEVNHGRS